MIIITYIGGNVTFWDEKCAKKEPTPNYEKRNRPQFSKKWNRPQFYYFLARLFLITTANNVIPSPTNTTPTAANNTVPTQDNTNSNNN